MGAFSPPNRAGERASVADAARGTKRKECKRSRAWSEPPLSPPSAWRAGCKPEGEVSGASVAAASLRREERPKQGERPPAVDWERGRAVRSEGGRRDAKGEGRNDRSRSVPRPNRTQAARFGARKDTPPHDPRARIKMEGARAGTREREVTEGRRKRARTRGKRGKEARDDHGRD